MFTRRFFNKMALTYGTLASISMANSKAYATGHAENKKVDWPFNCDAAISFTYDDGFGSNLDFAIPDLEDHGFRGTFYLTHSIAHGRAEEWRQACRRGHEIGNHTVTHPCDKLRSYTTEEFIENETGSMEQWLNDNIGLHGVPGRPDDSRTYAYTCGRTELGEGSAEEAKDRYLELVRKTFWAARIGTGAPVSKKQVITNPHLIPAFVPTNAEQAIEMCNKAAQMRGWTVLVLSLIHI